jgi:hypothetical protein
MAFTRSSGGDQGGSRWAPSRCLGCRPSRRTFYYVSRATIGFTRTVPDPLWALLFVTAVGFVPFPGGLTLAVRSIGMFGPLFAETIGNMDMAPIDTLALTGANLDAGVHPRRGADRAAGTAGDRAVSA